MLANPLLSAFWQRSADLLVGDPTKAANELGWKPKITFKALAEEMVDADMDQLKAELRKRGLPVSGVKAALVARLGRFVDATAKPALATLLLEHADASARLRGLLDRARQSYTELQSRAETRAEALQARFERATDALERDERDHLHVGHPPQRPRAQLPQQREATGACSGGCAARLHCVAACPCLLYTSPSPRDVEEGRLPAWA